MPSLAEVMALAPDAASLKAGEGLASVRKWLSIGRNDDALWGLLQGSGSNPYQTRVSLRDYASNCSCPSRKFPCKHAMGLLLILAKTPNDIAQSDLPDFVREWLDKRQQREQAAAVKATAVIDEASQQKAQQAAAKRELSREKRMAEGLAELRAWLIVLATQGLNASSLQQIDTWEQRSRRLNDAQLPGLARRVRELGLVATTNSQWLHPVIGGLGQLYLAIQAFEQRSQLSAAEQADLDRYLGVPDKVAEIDPAQHIDDQWLCLGYVEEFDDKLTVRRLWLRGQHSQRDALVLQFAVGNQPLPAAPQQGQLYALTLGFFNSAAPLRAHLITGQWQALASATPPAITFAQMQSQFAQRLGRDPWTTIMPCVLRGFLGRDDAGQWCLGHGSHYVPVTSSIPIFDWLALSGGETACWFGEWQGRSLHIVSVWPSC